MEAVLKGFLIGPVRGADPNDVKHHVEKLEAEGWDIHFPPRDTEQECDTGYNICLQNKEAIINADRVFIVWDGKSQGGLFDLGMTFALNKNIEIIDIPELLEGKSFQNMITEWKKNQ